MSMSHPRFSFSATFVESYPNHVPSQLLNALMRVFPIPYEMVNDSPRNSFQLNSTFDVELARKLVSNGFDKVAFDSPRGFEAKYKPDHAFKVPEVGTVVVEVEKADHQKLLYDLLKAHVYLSAGADFVVLLVPTTRGRNVKVNNVFRIGRSRLIDCERVGMISEQAYPRIVLVGFEQKYNGEGFNDVHRQQIQDSCRKYWKQSLDRSSQSPLV